MFFLWSLCATRVVPRSWGWEVEDQAEKYWFQHWLLHKLWNCIGRIHSPLQQCHWRVLPAPKANVFWGLLQSFTPSLILNVAIRNSTWSSVEDIEPNTWIFKLPARNYQGLEPQYCQEPVLILGPGVSLWRHTGQSKMMVVRVFIFHMDDLGCIPAYHMFPNNGQVWFPSEEPEVHPEHHLVWPKESRKSQNPLPRLVPWLPWSIQTD